MYFFLYFLIFFSESAMPLIIMTGFPSSGKSTAAKKIQQYFGEKGKEAVILTEGLSFDI